MIKKPLETLEAIYEYINTFYKLPTLKELADILGKKLNTIRSHLWALHKDKKLVFNGSNIESCEVVKAFKAQESGINWLNAKLV